MDDSPERRIPGPSGSRSFDIVRDLPPDLGEDERQARNTRWFSAYTSLRNVFAPRLPDGALYSCPCCGHPELAERGGYEICGTCGWEDDGQDDHDADLVRGGPNGRTSLAQARADFITRGGAPLPHRPPSEPV